MRTWTRNKVENHHLISPIFRVTTINGFSNKVTNCVFLGGKFCSVGSLGANGSYATVEQVNVTKCNFQGTQNGIRIKTWPVMITQGHLRTTFSFSLASSLPPPPLPPPLPHPHPHPSPLRMPPFLILSVCSVLCYSGLAIIVVR